MCTSLGLLAVLDVQRGETNLGPGVELWESHCRLTPRRKLWFSAAHKETETVCPAGLGEGGRLALWKEVGGR